MDSLQILEITRSFEALAQELHDEGDLNAANKILLNIIMILVNHIHTIKEN